MRSVCSRSVKAVDGCTAAQAAGKSQVKPLRRCRDYPLYGGLLVLIPRMGGHRLYQGGTWAVHWCA